MVTRAVVSIPNIALLAVAVALDFPADLHAEDLRVSLDHNEFTPGSAAKVRVSFIEKSGKASQLAETFKNPRTRYVACLEKPPGPQLGQPNSHDWPPPSAMSLPDDYCNLSGNAAAGISEYEKADEFAKGTTESHAYAASFSLPVQKPATLQHLTSPRLWVIARLANANASATPTTVIFGWTVLEYQCEPPAKPSVSSVEICMYRVAADKKSGG
jgi:hypothetical protein